MLSTRLLSSMCLLCSLAFSVFASEEEDKAKAKAALELAKAKRDREVKSKTTVTPSIKPKAQIQESGDWYTDLELSRRISLMLKKPLVIWVGVTPTDKEVAEIYGSLENDVIHVVVTSFNDDTQPRIIFPDKTGEQFRLLKSEVDSTSPIGIRNRIGLPVSRELYTRFKETYFAQHGRYYTDNRGSRDEYRSYPYQYVQPLIQPLASVSNTAPVFSSGNYGGTSCNT